MDAVDTGVKLYVENTAGGGRTIGRNPDEVAGILENIPGEFVDDDHRGADAEWLAESAL